MVEEVSSYDDVVVSKFHACCCWVVDELGGLLRAHPRKYLLVVFGVRLDSSLGFHGFVVVGRLQTSRLVVERRKHLFCTAPLS